MFPEDVKWQDIIHVINTGDIVKGKNIYLNADSLKQKAYLFID